MDTREKLDEFLKRGNKDISGTLPGMCGASLLKRLIDKMDLLQSSKE